MDVLAEETRTVEVDGEQLDLGLLDEALKEYVGNTGAIIPALQDAQAIYGYLPAPVLERIAAKLNVPLSEIYGVATFYAQFYLTRRGRHTVRCCDGTACHVRGAPKIVSAIEKDLGVQAGETTPDYRVTFEIVYCLGSCGLSPVMVVDDQVVGRLVPEKAVEIIRGLE